MSPIEGSYDRYGESSVMINDAHIVGRTMLFRMAMVISGFTNDDII